MRLKALPTSLYSSIRFFVPDADARYENDKEYLKTGGGVFLHPNNLPHLKRLGGPIRLIHRFAKYRELDAVTINLLGRLTREDEEALGEMADVMEYKTAEGKTEYVEEVNIVRDELADRFLEVI
ncbi:hypothetical protein FRC03_001769 [Tulasnella sp. 419]|nr:hypothetical protein FRC03_001769 [Tulasnella sp. 419]